MKSDPSVARQCFDPALSHFPVRRVPTGRIIDLLRVTHAPERVEEYRKAMHEGQRFPPVSVLPLAGRFLLADGHKRFAAYRDLARAETPVEIWTVRRWSMDQLRQLSRAAGRIARTLLSAPVSREARSELTRLLRSDLRHWRRMISSLLETVRS